MFCKYCGKPLDEGSVFCKYCGKQLTENAAAPAPPPMPNADIYTPVTDAPPRPYAIPKRTWQYVALASSLAALMGAIIFGLSQFNVF